MFCSLWTIPAQQVETVPLLNLLKSAEEQFDIHFNYLNEDVNTVQVQQSGFSSIDELIRFIHQNTSLQIKKVDQKTYVVNPKPYCVEVISFRTNRPLANFDVTSDKRSGIYQKKNKLHFSLSADTITISKNGFEKRQIVVDELKQGDCIKFYLSRINTLDEVIVQSFLTKGLRLQKFNKLQLQPTEFEVLPGLVNADVLQTTAQIPGVFSVDERISNISVRGGTHDQNLFLWNGARLYQTGHFFGMISALNPSINRKIDIYKNASPAQYSRGISSVFDISSAMNGSSSEKDQIAVNSIAARFKTSFSINDHQQISISARRSFTDLFRSPTYQAFFDKVFQQTALTDFQNEENIPLAIDEDFYFFDTSLRYENQIDDNNKLALNALAIGTQLHFEQIDLENNTAEENELDQDSYIVSADYSHDWNKKMSSSLQAQFSYYQQNAQDNTINSTQQTNQLNRVIDAGFTLNNEYQLNDNWQFKGGYQFSEIGIRNNVNVNSLSIIKQQKNVLRRHSAFLAADHSADNYQFYVGGNTNYFEAFDKWVFSPRLSFETTIARNLTAGINGEMKYQASSQVIDQQSDFFGVAKPRWVLANGDNIPIQESRQVDFGLTYQPQDWLLQLTAFQKKVEGINSRSQGFTDQLELLDLIGNYEVSGLEFFAQKQLKNWRLWSSYTFQDNTYEFDTFDPVFFTNNFERTHQVSAGISFTQKNYLLSIGGNYFSGRPVTPINESDPVSITNTINYLHPNSSHLNNYWRIDLTAAYRNQFENWRIKTGIGILNLTDHQVISERFYRLQNNEIQQIRRNNLGITPNVFLQAYF